MFKFMQIFVPLWIGFVACLAVGFVALVVWAAVEVIDAGPEGIGQFFGRIVAGFEQVEYDQ